MVWGTLLGVLGGVIAFGFALMFIGPTLLAVDYSLFGKRPGTPAAMPGHARLAAHGALFAC